MSYGLQIAASGVFTALYRQDVYSNNLANMDTPGFKPDIPSSTPRRAVREEDGVWNLPSNRLLERLGAGTLLNRNSISFAQGSLRDTGNPLDVGIRGEGFFAVKDGDKTLLTRDGRFTRNAQGMLTLAAGGLPILDDGGNPITIPEGGSLTIDGMGTLRVNGAAIARLQVLDIADRASLEKAGHSLFSVPDEILKTAKRAGGEVRQFSVEESGADEVLTIMQITSASRDVDANASMIREHDRLLDRAINTLGRVT